MELWQREYGIEEEGENEDVEDEEQSVHGEDSGEDSEVEDIFGERERADWELPDLREVGVDGFPRRRLHNPLSPTDVEIPDHPIDDEASLLRHFIQDNQEYLGVKSDGCIEKTVVEIMKYPRRKAWKTENDVKDFLFGWESLEWRRQCSERNSRNYANALVLKALWDINEKMKGVGYKGSLLTLNNQSLFANVNLNEEQKKGLRYLPKMI